MIPKTICKWLNRTVTEIDLHDIWCVKNPTIRSWSQSNPLVFSRLDYWLISIFIEQRLNLIINIKRIKLRRFEV